MVNRRPALYGAVFFTLFIIYGSLYPFNWQPRPGSHVVGDVLGIFTASDVESSSIDFGTNVLLGVPLAFCLMVYLRSVSRAPSVLLGTLVMGFCFALAVMVETLQLDLPGRVSSRWDVLAQCIGAALALLLWAWRGEPLWQLLFDWSPFNRTRTRWQQAAHVYLIAVFAYGLLPLDLTLSPADLYEKWKNGKVFLLPFHPLGQAGAVSAYEYASLLLIWGLAAWLMRKARALSATEVIGRTMLAAASLELMQLFVMSRTTDTTDVVLAGIAGLGVALFTRADSTPIASGELSVGRLALWLLGLAGLALALAWYPFEPRPDMTRWRAQLAQWRAAPLGAYFETDSLRAATTALQKALLFAPWGAIVAWQVPRHRTLGRTLLAGGVVLMLVVELGKLFLVKKSSNPSNILIEAFAMWVAYRWVRRLQSRRPADAVAAATAAWWKRWRWLLPVQLGVCTVALYMVAQTPGLPYNVRALVDHSAPWQVLCFSVALLVSVLPWAWWSSLPRGRRHVRTLSITAVLQPIVLYVLLRLSVPPKLVFDLVGSPVLDWPLEVEPLLRFMALNLIIAWGVLTAHGWLDDAPRNVAQGLNWVLATLAVVTVWHVVVVRYACTDNLIELMRDEGSPGTTALLFVWWALLYGSALQSGRVLLGLRHARHLAGIAAAGLLGYVCLNAALEPMLIKYDHVFSAWQFLLSKDRANYAPAGSLALRYAVAHLMLMGGVTGLLLPLLLRERSRRVTRSV